MKKTLYLKFVLAYIIFSVFGIIIITTFVPTLTKEHLIKEKASELYSDASLIASTYAEQLYRNETTRDQVKEQLDFLSECSSTIIQIISPSGRLILDTTMEIDAENVETIKTFDSTALVGSYYMVGPFFDTYPSAEKLSVLAPITSDYKVKGYVVIHYGIEHIMESCYRLLNISYVILSILLLLSIIILIFFTEIVYRPLRKITRATEQYA